MAVFNESALVETPKPSAPLCSPSGIRFAQSVSTYCIKEQRTSKAIYVVEIPASGEALHEPKLLIKDARLLDIAWLNDEDLLVLRPKGGQAHVDVTLSDAKQKEAWAASETQEEGVELWCKNVCNGTDYRVGEVPVAISDLKSHVISTSEAVLAFSAIVYAPERTPAAAPKAEKKLKEAKAGSDVRVYDSLFARHWDSWKVPEAIKQIQVMHLSKQPSGANGSSQWTAGQSHSPMADTALESPAGPFGDASDFDISATHLTFTAKTPHLNPATHTSQSIYVVPLHPKNGDEKLPKSLTVRPFGATSCPVFSPTFKQAGLDASIAATKGGLAWLQMTKDGYESDQNQVILYDFETAARTCLTPKWDRSPTSITWSEDGKSLYLIAEDIARKRVFKLDIASKDEPKMIIDEHAVGQVDVLPTLVTQSAGTRLLLSVSSMSTPNEIILAESAEDVKPRVLTNFAAKHLSRFELSKPEEFWFDGAYQGQKVHGWILRPPSLQAALNRKEKPKGKYPMAFLIHGGPQGAWDDSWSFRWNPQFYASQGYITIAIDPTGSTSYGQAFTDAIKNEWGGLPFKDLVAGYQYCLKTFEEIDPQRTVALGASYGGYMINWINGHNDAFGFKALVCHDGVFDTADVWYSGEELFFPEHDFGGNPYQVPEQYAKWNPRNHIANWKTPTLLIQGGEDFRLPETQAIGAFNTLQSLNIPSRLVYFESENHWVLNPLNSLQWHKEVFRWIEEWVGSSSDKQATRSGYDVGYVH